ncbi:hypothetical protein QWZ16_23950 [Vibrio ostreicida]|uniref:Uncharacterized protein n=1 Tax=Vibrio ostreicida TaxID=526588 RepID=A0ABT8BQK5_9VIBR|nr:hypothetical protein [Vibrio ostreicida]MDN3608721.1 hypothetical protein [Vibrio ostreicida]MDN3612646.1 hypothetical protein [Vibrio ostreicida]
MSPNSTLVAHLNKSKSRVESWPTWKQEQSGTKVKHSNSSAPQQNKSTAKELAVAY